MEWRNVHQLSSSVSQASAAIGDRWSLIILSELHLGFSKFETLQSRLGMSRTTLASRLKKFEDHGIVVRKKYSDRPQRFEYTLTQKGEDLHPVFREIWDWEKKYYSK